MNKKYLLSLLGSLAVIIAVSLAFFYPDAFEGNTLEQHDITQGMAMGQDVVKHQAATGEKSWWTNSIFSGMPMFQIAPSYESSSLFLWINKAYGLFLPQPANLLAMMMLGMLILLLSLRVKPWMAVTGAVAWGLSSYFVIIIGAGHLWKFYALTYVPPTIAGLIMIYNGRRLLGAAVAALFMMMQIANNHVQMTYYFCFVMLGLVIAYGVTALKDKKLSRWGVDTAILAGALLLGVAANAPNLYHTYEYSKQTMRGGHSELTAHTSENTTSGLDRDYITMYSYGRTETLSLLIPNIVGGASAMPVNGRVTGLTLADTDEGRELMRRDPTMSLLQLFSPYYGGAEGTQGPVYVGAIIFAMFIFGAIVVKGPVKWSLVVLTLLSILLALGRNLQWFTDIFIDYMPMYSKFRAVESILVIAEFTIPLLAILGLKELFAADNRKPYLKPLAISCGVCGLICLAGMLFPGIFGSNILGERDEMVIGQYVNAGALPRDFNILAYPAVLQAVEAMRAAALKADALRSLLFIAVAFIALWLMINKKLKAAPALAIVGIAIGIDLFTADKRYLNSDSFTAAKTAAQTYVATPADKEILRDTDPGYRVLDVTRFSTNDAAYFHNTVGGYHAAKLTRYQDMIDRHLAYVARPEVAQLLELRNDSAAQALYSPNDIAWLNSHLNVLDMLNTRYIIVDGNSAPLHNDRALGNAWLIDSISYVDGADAEMAALESLQPGAEAVADRTFEAILGQTAPTAQGDTITLASYAPNRIEYDSRSAADAVAVFSEVYFPWGWTATIDGSPAQLGRVNYILRALRIPAGNHHIVMEFKPKSIAATNAVSYAAVGFIYLLLLVGIALSLRKCRR
ncbi:MAG: YfhO family protein [Bacteroides sp.]|nr:YfhO family protein [Bacteroides sp.]MCM1379006.1 YfhO family protein [Bacteroides sp.]MCM1445622.1 YfhO family protein [Prevotella sp.]